MLSLLVACGACTSPPRPLPEAILGEWELLCRTDSEATSNCLGKEDSGLYKNFGADGKVVIGARTGSSMQGTWKLEGEILLLEFNGGGMRLEEVYEARIADDRLVLWYASRGFGSVYGRVGAPFEPAASKTAASSGPTEHTIGGVGYSLVLPRGYRLSRDDNDRQQWRPAEGGGFTVQLVLSPRPKMMVDGRAVTQPCDAGGGGVSSYHNAVGGVERLVSVGTSVCLGDGELGLSCDVEHSRGYLEEGERGEAAALCESLAAR